MTEELQLPEPIELNYTASAGTSLPADVKKATHEDIVGALKSVQDPELMLNVFDLGLVYKVNQKENGDVDITMTLTSPTFPMGDEMIQKAAQAVSSVVGVGVVTVNLTFDPPWTTDMLSDEIKLMMGI